MKTLRQSLIDYDLALLQAVAASRGVALEPSRRSEAVELLADALLAPAGLAIALTELGEQELEALRQLLEHGGRLERARFIRQYGPVRPMGPARLLREKPWLQPVNPAELLWYKGFICKGFQLTDQGGVEFIYIPDDLLPLLATALPGRPATLAEQPPAPALQAALAPLPPLVASGTGRLRENLFSLLVYLQITPIRLHQKTDLTAKDKAALAERLLPPAWPAANRQLELEFLLHLARRAGLVVVSHGRLKPDRDPTRSWLQSQPQQQERLLQNSWRADPTWNDLWRVPGLAPQPTGWENSPLLARAKILDYLAQLEAAPDTWYALADFVALVKQVDPDFQRPDGDYESWYIRDEQGQSLMGFDRWDQVEGALIRYLLTQPLLWLGVTEVGLPGEASAPTSFRLTPAGAAFLKNEPISPLSDQKPQFLQIDQNFAVHVPPQASLYDRFQLARFAEFAGSQRERPTYQITQASVSRAMRNGVTADQMVAFLARATNNRTPLKVVETLRRWGARRSTAKIETATLLRLADETLAAELRDHPELGPLLGEVIGPAAILIPPENSQAVRRWLLELGYLEP